jgi:putative transposase
MKQKPLNVEQTVGVLKQSEFGVPVAEVISKAGISEQTPSIAGLEEYACLEVDQVRPIFSSYSQKPTCCSSG